MRGCPYWQVTYPLRLAPIYLRKSIPNTFLIDLKLENILMSFENESIVSRFIKEQTTGLPMQCKTDSTTGRTVYRCHNDFGALDWRELKNMVPKIADFGLGTRLDSEYQDGKARRREVGIHPIQPDHYRAPEVILGCGWDFSADIWNFGVMVRDVFCFLRMQQGYRILSI